MKQYPKYKDSGIQWIGLVPNHWKAYPLKWHIQLRKGTKPEELSEEGIEPYVTMDFLRSRENKAVQYPVNTEGLEHIDDNDVLVLWDGANAGEIVRGKKGYLASTMAAFTFGKIFSREYMYLYLKGLELIFKRFAGGTTIPHFDSSILFEYAYPIPPLAEQEAIAHYLDKKTAKIDESVYLLEQQKADLQEFRKALISQTVTRGLNPNAKLKDSGIQWMGGVPDKWRIAPLKTLLSLLTDGTHQTPTYLDKGIPFVSIKDMSSGKLNFSDAKYISQEEHELLSKHAPVAKGDILFSRIGTLGVFIKVDTDEVFDIFVSLGLMKIIPDAINTDFLVYYLSSDTIRKYIDIVKAGEGTSAAKFNLTDVSKTPILLPSQAEQQAIVDYLDTKTAKINETIARIDTQIADLKAYRTALITEAVTGKMDVRLEN